MQVDSRDSRDPRLELLSRLDVLAAQRLDDAQYDTFKSIDFSTSCIVSAGAGSGKTRMASFLFAKARLRPEGGDARVATMSRTAKMEVVERAAALGAELTCDELRLPPAPLSDFQTLHAIGFKAQHDRLRERRGDEGSDEGHGRGRSLRVVFKQEICEMLKTQIKAFQETQGHSNTSFHPIESMPMFETTSSEDDVAVADASPTAVERAERDVVANMDLKAGSDLLYALRSERLKQCEPVANASFGRTAEAALLGLETAMRGGESEVLVDFDLMISELAESRVPIVVAGDVLFVDEAQDLSLAQSNIVLNSMEMGAIVVALGDESQGIFGFSGALPNTLSRIRQRAASARLPVRDFALFKNYRCTDAIVKFAEQFLPADERARRVGIVGNGDAGPAVRVACCDDEPFEVARQLVALLSAGTRPGDIAVLRHKAFKHGDELDVALRGHAERANLSKGLLAKSIFGLDVYTSVAMKLCAVARVALGLELFCEEPDEAIHLLKDFLRSCKGVKTTTPLAMKAIEQVWDEHRCPPGELFAMHHAAMRVAFAKLEKREDETKKKSAGGPGAGKRQKTDDGDSVKMKNFNATIAVAAIAVKEAERALGAWQVGKPLTEIGKLSFANAKRPTLADLVRHLAKTIVKPDKNEEVDWLISELQRKVGSENTTDGLTDAIASIVAERVSKNTEAKLLFSTIHRFKGKERPIVFLMGCAAPSARPTWPQRANLHGCHKPGCGNRCGLDLDCGCTGFQDGLARLCEEINTEKDRLLYVGATRAQRELYASVRSDAPPHRALVKMYPNLQHKRNHWHEMP